ncbi:MAG TPA: NAD(P)/FAD-dependent oxidoreductase [Pseudonocardia sp.]|jgi:thioredoxin reductase|nr:NAD(P)/FAD-dependent oxidoreductase [Pseudonocardia sp.]
MKRTQFDVIVIGGGGAGLSGALTLARARRSVLVLDGGQPRNLPATGVHGFLSRDGIAPAELIKICREEVAGYGATIVDALATDIERVDDGFLVRTSQDSIHRARRLLLTTGLSDELPEIEGLRARWGRDVLHCPYCHGWEVRDQPIGVLNISGHSAHQALLLSQWSADVLFFRHTGPEPSGEETARLRALGVSVIDGEVVGLEITDDELTGVRLADGRVVARRAVAVAPPPAAHSELAEKLGAEKLGADTLGHPTGFGERLATDPTGRTSVPGLWAAGNVVDVTAQVVASAAGGTTAAAMINADLIYEDADRAILAERTLER